MSGIPDAELQRRFQEAQAAAEEAASTQRLEAINRAIELLGDLAGDLRPRVPSGLIGNLAVMRLARYEAVGEAAREDLDFAVHWLGTLVASWDGQDPVGLNFVGNLARALLTRYEAGGPRTDLDEAIRHRRLLVDRAGEPGLLTDALTELAEVLRWRWDRDGEEADLTEAMAALERATGLAPDPVRLGRIENKLGILLARNSDISDDRTLLTQAIERFQASIDAYPETTPGRDEALNNLAVQLQRLARAEKADEPTAAAGHLDRAVSAIRELIELPDQPPGPLAERRHNLAVFLLDRYAASKATEDLEEAQRALALALSEASVQGPTRATFLHTEAQVELALYRATRDEAHADRASTAYDKVARSDGSMQITLAAARGRGSLEAERGRWPLAAEAFGRAVDTAERIYRGLAKRESKEAWLQSVSGLPQAAAISQVRAGDVTAAVEALERTRTMILAERLDRRRVQLDALRAAGHDALAERYLAAVAAWDGPASDSPAEIATESALDATIAEIRSVAGFERFAGAPGVEDLRALPTERPIVFLVVGRHGGVALVSGPGDDRAVPLPAFDAGDEPVWSALMTYSQTYDKRRRNFAGWLAGLDELTTWMGENVVGPVLDALDGSAECTLVPTGILSLLPWHAARTRVGEELVYACDRLAIAYAPSARALLALRPPTDGGSSLLAVEDPRPVSAHELPAARLEIQAIREHFSSVVRLPGEEASARAALDAVRGASCVHFACHGVAAPAQPAESYLLMAHDEPLTVSAITRQGGGSIPAELVVLSACETAVPGTLAPDEVVNLPTAFIEQGVGAVIGSLWVAPDAATALLMTRVYWNWREAHLTLPRALQEAQRWLRDATNGEIADWLTTVGGDNQGYRELATARKAKPADERPYAHPAYWAPFIYLGR